MSAPNGSELPTGAKKPLVLVVDDEPFIRQMIRIALRRQFDIVEAGSAEEALAIIDKSPALRAVVSDARMPGAGGIELMMEVQRRFPTIRRLLVSGYTCENADRLLREGIIDKFLEKPLDVREISSALRGLVP